MTECFIRDISGKLAGDPEKLQLLKPLTIASVRVLRTLNLITTTSPISTPRLKLWSVLLGTNALTILWSAHTWIGSSTDTGQALENPGPQSSSWSPAMAGDRPLHLENSINSQSSYSALPST